jgi:hypothetical protein
VYRGPFTVAADSTVKARAFRQDYGPSATASAAFVSSHDSAAVPTLTPGTGIYATKVLVTVASATPGAVIRYHGRHDPRRTTPWSHPEVCSPSIGRRSST